MKLLRGPPSPLNPVNVVLKCARGPRVTFLFEPSSDTYDAVILVDVIIQVDVFIGDVRYPPSPFRLY